MNEMSDRIAGLSPEKRALLERARAARTAPAGAERPTTAPERPEARAPADEPVAVVGMACRFPGGADTPEAFWRLLRDGTDATTPVPADRWDAARLYDPDPDRPGGIYARRGGFLTEPVDRFDASFFGISPAEAEAMDPQHRMLLEVAWEVLERGGTAPGALSGSRTGVYVGIGIDDYKTLQAGDEKAIDAYTGTGNLFATAAGRISHVLGLTGPSMAVDTACSSSLVAVHLAVRSLRTGETDRALAGGVHLMLSPEITLFLSRARALSPRGRCRTFDAAADGYARGEGCGMVVLRRLSDAVADGENVLAVIRGSAVNHDGPSAGLTVPNGPSQQQLIRSALADADASPLDISYLEAHGTGTPLGDPIEVGAFGAVLTEGRPAHSPLLTGSVKTGIGHLEAAAGVASLIKVVLALQHEEIPAHLNFEEPNPRIPWAELPVRVPVERTPWPGGGRRGRAAGISSFGIGGTNAHLVVAEPPAPQDSGAAPGTGTVPETARPRLLTLSARGGTALAELAERYAARLPGEPDWPAAAHTANAGRDHFTHRLAVVASDGADAARKLAAWAGGQAVPGTASGTAKRPGGPRLVFAFTGQGAQYPGMGRALYRTEPVFREAVDRCEQWLDGALGAPLTAVLFDGAADLGDTARAQPAVFALQYALTRLWASRGIRPDAVLGHSVGEYAAACAAGALEPRDALLLVAERGRLMSARCEQGGMAAVFADAGRVARVLDSCGGPVEIAAYNGPAETVLSGAAGPLDRALELLAADGIRTHRLEVSHAFHSVLMEPMLDALAARASRVPFRPARVPFFSTVTGDRLSADALGDPAYWRRNARAPVRFRSALDAALGRGCDAVLEIGPQPVLTGLARRSGAGGEDAVPWLPSLVRDPDDRTQPLDALGRLYAMGAQIDWSHRGPGPRPRPVALPTYPFQRRRYWRDTRSRRNGRSGAAERPLPGDRLRSPALRETVFQQVYEESSPGHLRDHELFGTVVVPGASHLALLLAAAEAEGAQGPVEAQEVAFPRALALRAGERRDVQIMLGPSGAGTPVGAQGAADRTFRIASAPTGDDAAPWTTHATGLLTTAPEAAPAHGGVQAVRARCTAVTSGEELHRRMARAGYGLGPSFRWIRTLHHSTDEVLAELSPPAEAGNGDVVHPGLLDSCFQAVVTLLDDDPAHPTGTGLYVPVRVDRLRRYRTPPPTGRLWLHLTEAPDAHDGDGTLVDLSLLDGEERVVLTMEGVRLRHVDRAALLGAPSTELRTTRWHPSPEAAVPGPGPSGRWLVVADDAHAAGELCRHMTAAGARCETVLLPESADRRPSPAAGARDAVTEAARAGEPPQGVIGLWTRPGQPERPAMSVAASALHLVQAAAALDGDPRLFLVTRGAQQALREDRADPAHAAVWGLGRVAAAELPRLRCTLVDLDARAGDPAATLPHLTNLLPDPGARELALREGVRHTPETVALPTVSGTPPRLRPDAAYLVTGGLGGVGLHLARHLADRGARHLALLARRAPGTDAERVLDGLRRAGVTVRVLAADVTDPAALGAALTELRAELPPLRGVVHAAGLRDDATLVRQDTSRLARVAAPKADGTRHLLDVLHHETLDFLLLFSSAAASFGTAGQGVYAAANAYLDALAQSRRGPGTAVTSIGWGPWEGTGMAAGLRDTELRRLADQGAGALSTDEALGLLDRVLTDDVPAHTLALRARRPADSGRPEPARTGGPAAAGDGEWYARPDGMGPPTPPATEREDILTGLWQDAFRIRPIGAEDDFFALGGDSMLALTITARARRRGLVLKESDFFQHPTVRALAGTHRDPGTETGSTRQAPDGADAATPGLSPRSERELRRRLRGEAAGNDDAPHRTRLRMAVRLARRAPQDPETPKN
ncbi:type I polyketide synthase [Streptomyces sp. JJ36]|uniref:type I polyketide synthase n=1 Tax=Streptomyces sp. JJ36 TaxID=2736645 RepID=UPI001F1D5B3B|nr:type I polyketide synthase [Streptomyces sp. JJ36]MCF6525323.1 SDR family NAD(P)-dependent oxidoreductase [Streptomyces sp. JJ36]